MQETTTTMRHRQADDRACNQDLTEQWKPETWMLSNTDQAIAHPAHQAMAPDSETGRRPATPPRDTLPPRKG